jgi:hypothetical protein
VHVVWRVQLNTRPLKAALPRSDEEKLEACRKLLAQLKLPVPKPELEEGEEADPEPEEEPPAGSQLQRFAHTSFLVIAPIAVLAEEEPNDGTFEDVIKTIKVMEVANIGLSDDEVCRMVIQTDCCRSGHMLRICSCTACTSRSNPLRESSRWKACASGERFMARKRTTLLQRRK